MAGSLLPLMPEANINFRAAKNPQRLTEVSQRHRKVPSTDILELWPAAMEGRWSQGAGLGTTGEGQRWGGKVGSVASTRGIQDLYY